MSPLRMLGLACGWKQMGWPWLFLVSDMTLRPHPLSDFPPSRPLDSPTPRSGRKPQIDASAAVAPQPSVFRVCTRTPSTALLRLARADALESASRLPGMAAHRASLSLVLLGAHHSKASGSRCPLIVKLSSTLHPPSYILHPPPWSNDNSDNNRRP